jgi:hypothetical protein
VRKDAEVQGCQVEIVTGVEPDEIVSFAAGELRDYVDRLFGIRANISPAPSEAEATFFLDAATTGSVWRWDRGCSTPRSRTQRRGVCRPESTPS